MPRTATARAHPNIALVKYWGKRDSALNLPAVPSVSMTLDRYETVTVVEWGVPIDVVQMDQAAADDQTIRRVLGLLDHIDPKRPPVAVYSRNTFPTGAGLASSSSGFAALALAAVAAAGQDLPRERISALARHGSGSACRSLWGGFVEWRPGVRDDGSDSHGVPIAPQDHWKVAMVVARVHDGPKEVGSTPGMERARATSPFYAEWVARAPADAERAKWAILNRDLQALGEVMESSTMKMFATMHTSSPPLLYWRPETIACLRAVQDLRRSGTAAWATMDAGPNVKVLCDRSDVLVVSAALHQCVRETEVLGPGADPVVEVRG